MNSYPFTTTLRTRAESLASTKDENVEDACAKLLRAASMIDEMAEYIRNESVATLLGVQRHPRSLLSPAVAAMIFDEPKGNEQ